jgi:hypothetical protein
MNGHHNGAVELEELWSSFTAARPSVFLHCEYPAHAFTTKEIAPHSYGFAMNIAASFTVTLRSRSPGRVEMIRGNDMDDEEAIPALDRLREAHRHGVKNDQQCARTGLEQPRASIMPASLKRTLLSNRCWASRILLALRTIEHWRWPLFT